MPFGKKYMQLKRKVFTRERVYAFVKNVFIPKKTYAFEKTLGNYENHMHSRKNVHCNKHNHSTSTVNHALVTCV